MRPLLLLVLFGAAACSGGSNGSASVIGSVRGSSLSAHDAIFASVIVGDVRRDAVLITDYTDACSKSQDNDVVPASTTLMLVPVEKDASGSLVPVSAGVFPIGAPAGSQRTASAVFQRYDSGCAQTFDATASQASGGTVTVTKASDPDYDFVDGSFDLNLPGGGHLTGSFHAAICPEPTAKPETTCKALWTAPDSTR